MPPSWSTLRSIGNSPLVRFSAIFPFVGYFVLFNDDVTRFLQAHGLESPALDINLLDGLWSKKLFFLYFGLMLFGIGSIVYQWRCPLEVNKHQDWKDYIAVEADTLSHTYLRDLGNRVGINYTSGHANSSSDGSDVMQRWHEKKDRSRAFARMLIALLFAAGALLLAIPSVLTATKVIIRVTAI